MHSVGPACVVRCVMCTCGCTTYVVPWCLPCVFVLWSAALARAVGGCTTYVSSPCVPCVPVLLAFESPVPFKPRLCRVGVVCPRVGMHALVQACARCALIYALCVRSTIV